uniref:Uncharacterized protein n=1 Tax=Micrurus lemniscatus lemniscatus TaxID=129467 RepID=A0A2D4JS47_MICLE
MFASLVEQTFLKPAELEAHPVCSRIKHLLKILDQHSVTMPEGYRQTAYVRTFFDYINKLAAIIFRSLTPEIGERLHPIEARSICRDPSWKSIHFAPTKSISFAIPASI